MKRYKKVISLSWPIILSYISFHILGIADLAMVGTLGKQAVASVGVALNVFMFIALPLEGFFDSTTILLSRALGANQMMNFKKYLVHELFLGALAGILGILLFFPLKFVVQFLSPNQEVFTGASTYLLITLCGLLPHMVFWVLMKFLMSIHKNKRIAAFSNLMVVINIILNYALIFGKWGFPALGIKGSAVATLVTRSFMAVVFGIYCYYVSRKMLNEKHPARLEKSIFKEIFSLGVPISQANLLEIGSWTFFVRTISGLGVAPLAAHEICMKIKDVAFLPGLALSSVATTLVGRSIGEGNEKEAKSYGYTSAWLSIFVMGAIAVFFITVPRYLLGIFIREKEVIDIGVALLRIMAMYQIMDAIFINFRGALNGVGDAKFVRKMILIGGWFIMLPIAYLFTNILHFGVSGAWIGLTSYVTITGFIMCARFIKTKWLADKAETINTPTPEIIA